MESQPNEIIRHILSYVSNRELMLNQRVSHRWKKLIEELFTKSVIPPLHMCILNHDYYNFIKYYSNYDYCKSIEIVCHARQGSAWIKWTSYVSESYYYLTLIERIGGDTCLKKQMLKNESVAAHDKFMGSRKHNKDIALKYASYCGHLEVVKYLVSVGADIHSFDNDDFPLQCSAKKGHLDIVKYLVNLGANIHAGNDFAFKYGTPEVIEYLNSLTQKN